jgi:hypothetical protein
VKQGVFIVRIMRTVVPILLGLLAGVLLLAAFRFVVPFIESALARHAEIRGSAEIAKFLEASALLNLSYVVAWTLIVFVSTQVAARTDGATRSVPALCAGGVFLAWFLADTGFLERQPLFYALFLVCGIGALLIAAGVFPVKRRSRTIRTGGDRSS